MGYTLAHADDGARQNAQEEHLWEMGFQHYPSDALSAEASEDIDRWLKELGAEFRLAQKDGRIQKAEVKFVEAALAYLFNAGSEMCDVDNSRMVFTSDDQPVSVAAIRFAEHMDNYFVDAHVKRDTMNLTHHDLVIKALDIMNGAQVPPLAFMFDDNWRENAAPKIDDVPRSKPVATPLNSLRPSSRTSVRTDIHAETPGVTRTEAREWGYEDADGDRIALIGELQEEAHKQKWTAEQAWVIGAVAANLLEYYSPPHYEGIGEIEFGQGGQPQTQAARELTQMGGPNSLPGKTVEETWAASGLTPQEAFDKAWNLLVSINQPPVFMLGSITGVDPDWPNVYKPLSPIPVRRVGASPEQGCKPA